MATATLTPLLAGTFTLPSASFVSPSSPSEHQLVPSLSFLITHTAAPLSPRNPPNPSLAPPKTTLKTTLKTTNILFDLGLRRDVTTYPAALQSHLSTRQPISTSPDVVGSLAATGLKPADIDVVVLSHVHWDHVGTPTDFPRALFVLGAGSLGLLDGTSTPPGGSHSVFERDLLPKERVLEVGVPAAEASALGKGNRREKGLAQTLAEKLDLNLHAPWSPHPNPLLAPHLPRTFDLFRDGTVVLVDAPGHLPGHINAIIQTTQVPPPPPPSHPFGPNALHTSADQSSPHPTPAHTSHYLAADAFHDHRLLSGEKRIAEWTDKEGRRCCIHADRARAEETIASIRALAGLDSVDVRVWFAHDAAWLKERE